MSDGLRERIVELVESFLNNETRPYIIEGFGFNEQACGLCQTDVPCESGIPQPTG